MPSLIRSRGERGWWFVPLLMLWGLAPLPAVGTELSDETLARARVKYTEGTEAYEHGDFHQALESFDAAYELAPLPGLLFDVAQCHRQLGAFERAAFFYRRYLALSEEEPANAPLVKELIAEMDSQVEQESASSLARGESVVPALPSKAPEPRGAPKQERSRLKDAERKALDIRTSRSLSAARKSLPPGAVPGEPEPPRESLARKWWVWAGAGAVVLLAGGVIYAVTAPEQRPTTLGTFPAR